LKLSDGKNECVIFGSEPAKMSEPAKNPFDALLDAFRQIVREEISKAATNNTRGIGY
jgi:hypothetical protein